MATVAVSESFGKPVDNSPQLRLGHFELLQCQKVKQDRPLFRNDRSWTAYLDVTFWPWRNIPHPNYGRYVWRGVHVDMYV